MRLKITAVSIVLAFVAFCAILVAQTGLFNNCPTGGCTLLQAQADINEPAEPTQTEQSSAQPQQTFQAAGASLRAPAGPRKRIQLGAQDPATEDPETGFKFQITLDTLGASIASTTFSNGQDKGFDNRDPDNPQPLILLRSVESAMSMSNEALLLYNYDQSLPLGKLNWQTTGIQQDSDGSQSCVFEATITADGRDTLRLIKTYSVTPTSYDVRCRLEIENLTDNPQQLAYRMTGPIGMDREGVRADQRKALMGLLNPNGEVIRQERAINKFDEQAAYDTKPLKQEKPGQYLWTAIANKYFAVVLVPDPNGKPVDWIDKQSALYYNLDGIEDSGDEYIGTQILTAATTLTPTDTENSTRVYDYLLYIGPKDKRLFDRNSLYDRLGFVQLIDFRTCCCPAALIKPLAFGILAFMNTMYKVIPNYGVVIIILVFLVRIILHPLTKKSQVSMSKMTKLGPRAEEIKKKYEGNKQEMNKQLMLLYREEGATPIMGMLPMFVQMPIWIALWTAIYTGIELRGAQFLPFWITDLSTPDALFRFSPITIPLVGWTLTSFNLLPILMGVAFYLQQKMMPTSAAANTNPQVAQQQKMMKIMLPLIFPLALYSGPSGVNLYIMSSVFAGVIEQRVIRKHIQEREQAEAMGKVPTTKKAGGKKKMKKGRPPFRTFR